MKKLLPIAFLLVSISARSQCVNNTNSLQFRSTVPSPNDHVTFSTDNGLIITNSITLEAWIMASVWAATPAQGTIVCKHNWASNEQGYVLRAGGTGQLSFNFAGDSMGVNKSWQDLISGTNALTLNTWYHVAGTFDGDTSRIYINGVQAGATAFKGTIVPSTAYPVAIGMLSDQAHAVSVGGRYWKGKIDEVRIWSRALSQSEIQSNMNNHLDTAGVTGLAGYWRFNEGLGTPTDDMSSNNNNGTLSANAMWTTVVPFTNGPPKPTISYSAPILTCDSPAAAYQWFLYNIPVAVNGNQQTYTPIQSGNYTVQITDNQGCTSLSDPLPVIVIGIENIAGSDFAINYTIQESTLNITVESNQPAGEITLSDCLGRIIISQPIEPGQTLITSKPVAGAYILTASSGKNRFTRKITVGY